MTNSPSTLILFKPLGATPLDVIRAYQQQHPEYNDIPLGYAGRLDPMAEGLLLILVGEENKKRKHYEQLSKTYEFEILFGIATDSYDILGLVTDTATPPPIEKIEKQVPTIQKQFTGTIRQHYPPYSSKPVNGKPLYWWARAGRLEEICIPEKIVGIQSLEYLSSKKISNTELASTIQKRIALVQGKFRQQEILEGWKTYFAAKDHTDYPIVSFRATVESGTYIRSLVHDIGQLLHLPTMTVTLKRTMIGNYSVETQGLASLQ